MEKHEDYGEVGLTSTNRGDSEAGKRFNKVEKKIDRFSYSCFIRILCVYEYFRFTENILLVGISTCVSDTLYFWNLNG